ncbi:MAG TPA: radical SAM protein [Armatimonadota bacterium]|nr:radical SAM protein [Armatimonadota bacterium]
MQAKRFKHLYGPVPSRRLGRSLGVDIVPYKVCSYDCIYCQLGRTTRLTSKPQVLIRTDDVIRELQKWLADGHTADYITFSGSGEPTLNSELDEMVGKASLLTDIPIAVITNGSLLSEPAVRAAVSCADLLLPSLDAGTEEVFSLVNRPADGIRFHEVIEGLERARQEFAGEFWLEVMLVQNLNDSEAELEAMRRIIDRMQPDKVQINTVERPSRSGEALPVSDALLSKACEILGPCSEVIAPGPITTKADHACESAEDALLDLLGRRPCKLLDITAGTNLHLHEAVKHLRRLMSKGLVISIGAATDPYYCLAEHEGEKRIQRAPSQRRKKQRTGVRLDRQQPNERGVVRQQDHDTN